jgi:8-amino-7-oxononanoate synthase
MELIEQLQQQLDQLSHAQLRRRRRVVGSPCAPAMQVDGQPLLAFCSNDYLGLANHPALIEALAEGARIYGVGSGASHLINGHSHAHVVLEERFADWLSPHIPSAGALTFSTGYMANLGVLTGLGGPHAELFSEELNHASLIDGARLSRSQVRVYPHGRIDLLADLLAQSQAQVKIVVTDSVFSMDGDIAPLPEMLALCERHGAWLVVDDAHGFGVLGQRGRGVLSHFDLRSPYLVYVGTLGKAAGVAGAFVAAHETVIDWLVNRSRPYIYTTASPPALSHALMKSLDLIEGEEGDQRRSHLRALIAQVRHELRDMRWQLMPSETAIQPVIIGSNSEVQRAAAALQEQGIWVPPIRPPTVPADSARLRVTLSAAHTREQASRLTSALLAIDSLDLSPAP